MLVGQHIVKVTVFHQVLYATCTYSYIRHLCLSHTSSDVFFWPFFRFFIIHFLLFFRFFLDFVSSRCTLIMWQIYERRTNNNTANVFFDPTTDRKNKETVKELENGNWEKIVERTAGPGVATLAFREKAWIASSVLKLADHLWQFRDSHRKHWRTPSGNVFLLLRNLADKSCCCCFFHLMSWPHFQCIVMTTADLPGFKTNDETNCMPNFIISYINFAKTSYGR